MRNTAITLGLTNLLIGNWRASASAGWSLRDLAGKTWSLDVIGTLAAGQEKIVKRLGQSMAMNNGGDTIDLVDPQNRVVQTVTYGRVDEDEEISIEP